VVLGKGHSLRIFIHIPIVDAWELWI